MSPLALGLILAALAAIGVLVHLLRDAKAQLRCRQGDLDASRAMNGPLQRGLAEQAARAQAVETQARETVQRMSREHAAEVNDLVAMLGRCEKPEDVNQRLEAAGFVVRRDGPKG